MLSLQIWLLPLILLVTATAIAFPFSRYLAWIMDGKYHPLPLARWCEAKVNSGPQPWKQYAASLLCLNTLLFLTGFLILSLQPWLPLNPLHKTLLSPTTIFHSAASFMTNTDLQHYTGEAALSNGSQILFGLLNLFLSAATGVSVLAAIIRALRGDASVGNYFLDMWRVIVYVLLPLSCLLALLFIQQGTPMTFASTVTVASIETGQPQILPLGPVAAFEAIKMLGTNGGGFYGMNSAHPFENPTALSNFFSTLAMMLCPFALVLTYGRMLGRFRHGLTIFGVMLVFMTGCITWTVYFDTLQPNPATLAHPAKHYGNIVVPATTDLPVTATAGNLEGKELRFGTSASATYAAITTNVTTGAINAEMDSLNPLASLAPLVGMWLNCIFGGNGVGMINMLIYIVLGIFIAGMMVGRTPEYLGKKIGVREVRLAIITLLVEPLLMLMPLGFFAATHWGSDAITNPGAHGLTQMLYQLSSAAANNGSAFDGLTVSYGFYDNPSPPPAAMIWDIVTGLIMILSRYFHLIAPLAMSALLGAKKSVAFGVGTLRDDTPTFALLLFGNILILGALLFLPVMTLGPLAEHLGPQPFGW